MEAENNIIMEDTQLTDDQAEAIAKDLDEFVKGTDTETIQNLPSNNGVETRVDTPEDGEFKTVNTSVNPMTGETIILNADEVESETDFNKLNVDDLVNTATEAEITEAMQEEGVLKSISKDMEWSTDEIKQILEVTNRRIKKENFNVYKAFPESVKKMIDDYIHQELGITIIAGAKASQINAIRNSIAENIVDQFQNDITLNRAKHDFAHELATIYKVGTKDISESAVDYMTERNKVYREEAEKMEDPEKKERMLAILDRIDQARDLGELKEFAKKCKVKSIEIEKPKKVLRIISDKYANSANNIYDIDLCKYTLARNLPERTDVEILCFLIVFCKYIMNWDINIPLNHAFIYYVLYYSAMLDGDKSDVFKNNVREVIDIIKERNPGIKYGEVSEEEMEAKLKEYDQMMEAMKKYEEEAAKKEAKESGSENLSDEEVDVDDEESTEEDDEIYIPEAYSYRGFTRGFFSNEAGVTVPEIMAIPDGGGTPISIMRVEDYMNLPEETRDNTLKEKFNEIIDAYLDAAENN